MVVFPQNDNSNMQPRLVLTRSNDSCKPLIELVEMDWDTVIGQVDLRGSTKSQTFDVNRAYQFGKGSQLMDNAVLHLSSETTNPPCSFSLVVNIRGNSNDGSYLGFDCDQVTLQYFVFTFDLGPYDPETETSAYIIIAKHDDPMNVEIFLPYTSSDELIAFEGAFYGSRDVIKVKMQVYQSLQIQAKFDLTGTRIESNDTMIVVAGLNKTRIGAKNSTTSHVTEMMPPLTSGGTSYVLVPAPVTSHPSIFRFINVYWATQITVFSENMTQTFYLSRPGSYAEVTCGWPGKYCYAASTKNILAYRIAPSTPTDQDGDAAMTVLIPSDGTIDSKYRLTIPQNTPPRKTFLTIVITKGREVGIRQDGVALCSTAQAPPCVAASYFNVTGSDALVAVVVNLTSTPNMQTLTWSHATNAGFIGYVDSFNKDEGEGYPLGHVNVNQSVEISFPDTDRCCVSIDGAGVAKEDDECTQLTGNIPSVGCCVLNGDVVPCKVRSYQKSCRLQAYTKQASVKSVVNANNFLECQNRCERKPTCAGANFVSPDSCQLLLGPTNGFTTSSPGRFIHCRYGASMDIMG